MACGCEVLGDLVVFVPEESQRAKQIVRKAATERAIVIDPAIRLYYARWCRRRWSTSWATGIASRPSSTHGSG